MQVQNQQAAEGKRLPSEPVDDVIRDLLQIGLDWNIGKVEIADRTSDIHPRTGHAGEPLGNWTHMLRVGCQTPATANTHLIVRLIDREQLGRLQLALRAQRLARSRSTKGM